MHRFKRTRLAFQIYGANIKQSSFESASGNPVYSKKYCYGMREDKVFLGCVSLENLEKVSLPKVS